jgi:hypothetical protein
VEGWLEQLAQELRTKTYRPQAVRRVHIPKPDGQATRALGVPALKDRVAQMAAVTVLEAIFEADLTEEQYASKHMTKVGGVGGSAPGGGGRRRRRAPTGGTGNPGRNETGFWPDDPGGG